LAVAGTFLPFTACSGPDPSLQLRLSVPAMMATLSDSKTIMALGNAYMEQVPEENSPGTLIDRLMMNSDGTSIPETSDSLVLQEKMQQKVRADFENGATLVIQGWVLSQTEARQCALYSLTQSNN